MKIHEFDWNVANKSPELASLIRKVPIVLFAAYDRPRLLKFTRYVRELDVDVSVCNDVRSLVSNVIATLSEGRSKTYLYPTAKRATTVSAIDKTKDSK